MTEQLSSHLNTHPFFVGRSGMCKCVFWTNMQVPSLFHIFTKQLFEAFPVDPFTAYSQHFLGIQSVSDTLYQMRHIRRNKNISLIVSRMPSKVPCILQCSTHTKFFTHETIGASPIAHNRINERKHQPPQATKLPLRQAARGLFSFWAFSLQKQ